MKAILPQLLMLSVLLGLVWQADIYASVSLSFPLYIIIALISCGFLLLPCVFVRRRVTAAIPCGWMAFLLVLPFLANSSLKPMLWGVRDLEQGMSRETVLQTINAAYAGTQYPMPVVQSEEQGNWGAEGQTMTRLLIKPEGRAPELQAESLLVFFEDGRFSHASFSPD